MQVDIAFGNVTATITGTYYPGTPAKMYLANGDPGYPEEYPDFDIDTFEIGGEDILEQLTIMRVLRPDGRYVDYLDSILDIILEKAYTQHRDTFIEGSFEEHCSNGYYSKWH